MRVTMTAAITMMAAGSTCTALSIHTTSSGHTSLFSSVMPSAPIAKT